MRSESEEDIEDGQNTEWRKGEERVKVGKEVELANMSPLPYRCFFAAQPRVWSLGVDSLLRQIGGQ